jgi:hypothetical protein
MQKACIRILRMQALDFLYKQKDNRDRFGNLGYFAYITF